MELIVHFPPDAAALSQRVAAVHAQAVLRKVQSLNCPLEQKIALLDAVKGYVQKSG